jgi:hypothetical protein
MRFAQEAKIDGLSIQKLNPHLDSVPKKTNRFLHLALFEQSFIEDKFAYRWQFRYSRD